MRGHLQRLWGAEGVVLAAALTRTVIVARILGVEDFGVAALATAFPSLIFMMLDPQSEEAVIKFSISARASGRPGTAVDVLRLAYRIDVLLASVGLVLVSLSVVFQMHETVGLPGDAAHLVLFAAVGSAATAPIASARAWLTGVRRTKDIALGGVTGGASRLIGGVVGAVVGGVDGFVLGTVVGTFIELAVFVELQRRSSSREAPGRKRARTLELDGRGREIVRFMVLTDLTTLSSVMVKHLDLLILGSVGGPSVAGPYRLARSVSAPAGAVLRPLQTVAYPRLVELAERRDAHALRQEIKRYVLRLSIPLLLLGSVAVALLPLAVPLMAGSEYESAVAPAVVLAGGSVLGIAAFWIRPTALALGREASLFVIGLSMTILTVAGYFAVAQPFGAPGIAATRSVFAVVVGMTIAGWVVNRAIGALGSPGPPSADSTVTSGGEKSA